MAVLIDVICSNCERIQPDIWSDQEGTSCQYCITGKLQWHPSNRPQLDPNTHTSERVIVYESLKEGGHIQYPGRTDMPVPKRLVDRGYVRKELNVRDLASFERKHHVANERRHYDRNGRGLDD